MISYNKKALNDIFEDLSVLLKANLSLFDENFESAPVANFGNKSQICESLNQYMQKLCSASDANALRRSIKEKNAFVYECHLGFNEIIIPFSIIRITIFLSYTSACNTFNICCRNRWIMLIRASTIQTIRRTGASVHAQH